MLREDRPISDEVAMVSAITLLQVMYIIVADVWCKLYKGLVSCSSTLNTWALAEQHCHAQRLRGLEEHSVFEQQHTVWHQYKSPQLTSERNEGKSDSEYLRRCRLWYADNTAAACCCSM